MINSILLKNGISVPMIGLGANGIWGGMDAKESELAKAQYEIYRYALESNKCKLFDTSGSYGWNERILGEAIKDANKRKDVLLMTKIGNKAQREKNIRKAVEESLKKLQTEYIDIYLIHWPQYGTFVDTYLEMEKLYEEGILKAIGVCNCQKHHLEELKWSANIAPMVNQVEVHPLFTQDTLNNYCYANDIKVIAYSPLGRMHDVLIKAKPIRELCNKYNKTPAQIILRWHYQNNRITIPQTKSRKHFDEIYEIEQFVLTEKEIAWISSINDNIRLRYNPDNCDFMALG